MFDVDLSRFPILSTERLILREVVAEDADDVFTFRGDAEVQRYNLVPMRDHREALGLIRTMRSWYMTRYAIQWGITLRDENRVLGLCGVHEWDRRAATASIGYDLVRSHWGQGIASEAMREVVRYAFDELKLVKADALTVAQNARSIRLLEQLGFALEGPHRPRSPWQAERFQDSVVYGLSRSTYYGTPPPDELPQG